MCSIIVRVTVGWVRSESYHLLRGIADIFNPGICLIAVIHYSLQSFHGGSVGKESACSAEDKSSIPGSERYPKKGMATHSNILAWEIPWTEGPGRLTVCGVAGVRHYLAPKPPLFSSVWITWRLLVTILKDYVMAGSHSNDSILLSYLYICSFCQWMKKHFVLPPYDLLYCIHLSYKDKI